jgi:hypothetical protein
VPILAAWANRNAAGLVDGMVTLHSDGTLKFLLNRPLHAARMEELMELVAERMARQSGVRSAVDAGELIDLASRRAGTTRH